MPDFSFDGEKPALVDDGTYSVVFEYYETIKFNGKYPKLAIWFHIIDSGSFFEMRIPGYYNVKTIQGKPRRWGSFKTGWKSDFTRQYARLFELPQRLDRMPMSGFKDCIIKARIRTVCKDYKQRKIADSLKYSVIDELIKIEPP